MPICRTQSIVSVSEHANKDSPKAAAKDEKGVVKSSIKTRRRKKVSSISMSEAAKAKRDPQERTSEDLFKLRKSRQSMIMKRIMIVLLSMLFILDLVVVYFRGPFYIFFAINVYLISSK